MKPKPRKDTDDATGNAANDAVKPATGPAASGPRTFYIGSDPSDDYTTFAAFAAAETPVAGDTISFRKGDTFHEKIFNKWSGTATSPIYYTAHGTGAAPQLWGSYQQASWTKTGGRTHVYQCAASGNDMDIIHTTIDSSAYWHVWQYSAAAGPKYLTAAADVAGVDAAEGTCWYDAPNNIMYIYPWGGGDPNSDGYTYYIPDIFTVFCGNDGTANQDYIDVSGLSIQYAGRYPVASFDPAMVYNCSHVTLSDCNINVSRHDGIVLVGTGQTVSNCYLYDIKANGVLVCEGIAGEDTTSINISGCYYTDTNGDSTGQYANGFIHLHHLAKNVTVTNCVCSGSLQAVVWSADNGTPTDISITGLTVSGQPNRFVRLNTSNTNVAITGLVASEPCLASPAVDFGAATNPRLSRSFIPGSAASNSVGIDLDGMTGLLCDYSVLAGFSKAGVYGSSPTQSGAKFHNCVIADNYEGYYGSSVTTNKPEFRNCIFFNNTRGVRASTGQPDMPDSDYNCFYGNTTDLMVTTTPISLATAQGYGYEINSQHADPLFLNAGGSYALPTDFQIPTGSPCKNAGTDVGLTADFWGNAISGNPDMGIYEFH